MARTTQGLVIHQDGFNEEEGMRWTEQDFLELDVQQLREELLAERAKNKLLYEIYHQAWHALDHAYEVPEGAEIDPGDAAELATAVDRFEEAYPNLIHGEKESE